MAKHCMALTAKFKIDAVRAGDCTQTIRKKGKKPVEAGDEILFHGWAGKPRHSRWSWRLRVIVSEVLPVSIYESGIYYRALVGYGKLQSFWSSWGGERTEALARRDGFKNAADMRAWFMEHYGKVLREENPFQVIRWYPPKEGE